MIRKKSQWLSLKNMAAAAMMAAVLCVLSPISIPIPGAVTSITLATFAVYLTSAALPLSQSILSILIYILIGAVGLPVFANYSGGIGVIAGPTGGYIIGYIVCAAATGLIIGRFPKRFFVYPAAIVVGAVLCYTCGTVWFVFLTGKGLAAALSMCVIPYIPFDIVKIAAASALAFRLRRLLSVYNINSGTH